MRGQSKSRRLARNGRENTQVIDIVKSQAEGLRLYGADYERPAQVVGLSDFAKRQTDRFQSLLCDGLDEWAFSNAGKALNSIPRAVFMSAARKWESAAGPRKDLTTVRRHTYHLTLTHNIIGRPRAWLTCDYVRVQNTRESTQYSKRFCRKESIDNDVG